MRHRATGSSTIVFRCANVKVKPAQIREDIASSDVDVLDAEVGEVHLADVGEVGRVETLSHEVLRQSTSKRVLRSVALRRLLQSNTCNNHVISYTRFNDVSAARTIADPSSALSERR